MKKSTANKAHVKYSWGILVGMLAIPILAVMVKVFPQYTTGWEAAMVAAGLIILRSVIGYVTSSPGAGKKAAATHAH